MSDGRTATSTGRLFCFWGITLLTATLSKPLELAQHGMNLWRKRRLSGAFLEAQAVLGKRMYAAGLDDGELGAKISALDERLRRVEAARGSTHVLKAARRHLVLRLATAALEDDGRSSRSEALEAVKE
jgi:hypothetical protein